MLGRAVRHISRAAAPVAANAAAVARSAQPAAAASMLRPAAVAAGRSSAPARLFSAPASHGKEEPHAVDPADELPWKFGEDPTKPRKVESWEYVYIPGMGFAMILTYIVLAYGPNTSPTWWAREEALHTGFKVPDVQPDLEDD